MKHTIIIDPTAAEFIRNRIGGEITPPLEGQPYGLLTFEIESNIDLKLLFFAGADYALMNKQHYEQRKDIEKAPPCYKTY